MVDKKDKPRAMGIGSGSLTEKIAQSSAGDATDYSAQVPEVQDHFVKTSALDYPTVYADGCVFATRLGSTVRLAFTETILEAVDGPFPGLKARHVGTLVLPVEGFRDMLEYLNKIAPEFIFPKAEDGE